MKLGMVLLVHRDVDQVVRLVDRLDHPDTTLAVHVGFAEPDIHEPLRARLAARPNVHFLPRRRIHWGDWSLAAAILDGLRFLADVAPDADFLLDISGQDYPLKTPEGMREVLAAGGARSYVDHFRIPARDGESSLDWSLQRGGLDRIEYLHFHRYNRRLRLRPLRPRRFPHGLEPWGGQAWWVLAREAAAYVLRFLAERPDVPRFFRRVDVPDELLFQSILLSSPLRDTIVNDDLRRIVWKPGRSHPELVTTADLDELGEGRDLFTRKVDVVAHPGICDEIDRRLLGVPVP